MEFDDLRSWGEEFLSRNSNRLVYARIFSWWEEIVGHRIARITRPVYLKNKILTVDVKEQAWQTELGYHTPTIIEKYQKKLAEGKLNGIEIKVIRFKYNPYFEERRKPPDPSSPYKKHTHFPPTEPLTAENAEARLQQVMRKLRGYANGKNTHPPTQVSTMPRPQLPDPRRRTHKKINIYYPEIGLYSEFIHPPDELQNFDLY